MLDEIICCASVTGHDLRFRSSCIVETWMLVHRTGTTSPFGWLFSFRGERCNLLLFRSSRETGVYPRAKKYSSKLHLLRIGLKRGICDEPQSRRCVLCTTHTQFCEPNRASMAETEKRTPGKKKKENRMLLLQMDCEIELWTAVHHFIVDKYTKPISVRGAGRV